MIYYNELNEANGRMLKAILPLFTRNELRAVAKDCDIRQGRLKADLVRNLSALKNRSKLNDFILEIKIY
jgi:hypothetical protein